MTAPLLNVSAFSGPVAQPGAAAGAQDPAAAFEAMMAAFLGEITAPQQDVPGAVAGQPVAAVTGEPAPAEGETEETAGDAEAAAQAATPLDQNAAVLAALAEAPATPVVVTAAAAGAVEVETGKTPPAWGQGKTPGQPAAPALAEAAPDAAFLSEDVGAETPAVDGEAAAEAAPQDVRPQAAAPPRPAAPQAQAQAPGATPVQAPAAANADVPAPAQAIAAADPEPPAAGATTDVPAAQAVAAETQAAPVQARAAEAGAATPRGKAEPKAERKLGERVEAFAATAEGANASAAPRSAPVHAKADVAKPGAERPQEVQTPAGDSAAAPAFAEAFETPATAEAAPAAGAVGSTASAHGHAAAQVRGSPETVANLSAQILKKLDGRSTRFDVELDPIGLGKVDVRVEIGAHGKMTAALSFENAHAAQELKARAGELQKALEQAGFDLSGGMSFDVASDQGRSGQGFLGEQPRDNGAAFRGRAFRAALDTADQADAVAARPLTLRRGVTAGLDVRI
ncbi:flagellar hook-length control protein FliK [Phenylobacterium sp.]|uniref:flagellar hook-length control protein FliK n=1 Tax=Phenylobacterium sp. TaxID=1871053 RepID=UPI0035AE149C